MHRRTALRLGATGVTSFLAGCASLRNPLRKTVPKSYKVHNGTSGTVTVRVSVFVVRREKSGEASHERLSSRTFKLSPRKTKSAPWPKANAKTYQIKARLRDERWTALSFSPSDWHQRNTPVVSVSDEGVSALLRQ